MHADMATGAPTGYPPGRTRVAWAFYDWANSAFTTLVVTFVYAAYFTAAIAPDEVTGTAQWSRAVAASGIAIAVLSPLLGAMADRGGRRRRYLAAATWICCAATAALTFVHPGMEHAVLLALVLFAAANIAFELGGVFYNAFLPEIARKERMGRMSGWAWGLGYAGGLACLAIALAVLVRDDPLFGIDTEGGLHYRATNLLVAGWFALFSLPLLMMAPRQSRRSAEGGGPVQAYRALLATLRQLRDYREIMRLLIARLVYNDGLVTVFSFGGIYAAGTFGLSLSEVIVFGIAINVAAGAGAALFGFVDDRVGARTTILVSLVGLTAATLLAAFASDVTWLWVAAIGIGIFVGPNQSASRSLLARFVPERQSTEFFGFFAFSGKITAFLGPLLFGIATEALDSQRAGVATVVPFFVAGGLLLLTVNEERGVAASRDAARTTD